MATQIFLEFSTRILEEDEPILTSIFFRWAGLNHQLVSRLWVSNPKTMKNDEKWRYKVLNLQYLDYNPILNHQPVIIWMHCFPGFGALQRYRAPSCRRPECHRGTKGSFPNSWWWAHRIIFLYISLHFVSWDLIMICFINRCGIGFDIFLCIYLHITNLY